MHKKIIKAYIINISAELVEMEVHEWVIHEIIHRRNVEDLKLTHEIHSNDTSSFKTYGSKWYTTSKNITVHLIFSPNIYTLWKNSC